MTLSPSDWRSKIIGHDKVDPETLIAHPDNFRVHPVAQREALAASIRELGYIRSVTVNVNTGHIVDGHERVMQALQLKAATGDDVLIDVEYVDLSPEQEKLALAIFDPISAMAEHDATIYNQLLADISTGEEALQELLTKTAEECGALEKLAKEASDQTDELGESFAVMVTCDSEQQQADLLEMLTESGYKCRAMVA